MTHYLLTTLGRSDQQETLSRLHPTIRERTTVVVQRHEWQEHQYLREVYGVAEIMALPGHVRTLGPTRQYLLDSFRGERIVMLDDDLTWLYRLEPGVSWQLGTFERGTVLEPFLALERLMDDGYVHCSISGREGNNRVSKEIVECTRYMRVLAYRTGDFPASVRMDRVSGMSDFDTNLQLLRAGYPSAVNFWFAQGQGGTQQPGGCTLERNHETHSAEVAQMLEMHPGLCKSRLKVNKGGGDFGQREELTVWWKRALGHG